MHTETLSQWMHRHDFAAVSQKGEGRTRQVLGLTVVAMIVEIVAGAVFGSMALLADGWHMGTHAAAFAIALFTYRYARKHAADPTFTFGTGKVSVLGGFASAVALAAVSLMMIAESLARFIEPQAIAFNEAIGVAVLGLVVNVVSALLLGGGAPDHDDPGHPHPHAHHSDHNLSAAYAHVLADALTSLLAIAALLAGKFFGWTWMDPLAGTVGAVIIARWAYGLLKDTSPILLDNSSSAEIQAAVKARIEADADNRVADLHLWKVGPKDYAAIVSLVTHTPQPTEHYRTLLAEFTAISHLTIETIRCPAEGCDAAATVNRGPALPGPSA